MAEESSKGWLSRAKAVAKELLGFTDEVEQGNELAQADGYFGYDHVTVSTLLGTGKRQARSRADIYTKWHYMAGDPIIATALRLHVTMALGGHETTGDTVFIEPTPEAETDKTRKKYADEIAKDLGKLFNRIAPQVAFNACAFGDAYGRIYYKDGRGIVSIYTDEMIYPPLVQPYERGDKTAGYVVSTGQKFTERLTIKQMARVRMPRMLYVAQNRVIEKAMRHSIKEDDVEALPLLPSLAGGSFLEAAEEAYDNLINTLTGLVGQRILSSIDESMIGVNLEGMTKEQRKLFMDSMKNMLLTSKKMAEDAIKSGKPVTERRYHIMPTFAEKQLAQISQFNGTGGAASISIEDVMLHAKLLAGALGVDLSMLGFADILSGGLGEGGFFRTSAQAAERSRIIRTSLQEFFEDLIDLHCLHKYGWVFEDGDRPVRVNFYGSISALESEQMASRERAANATAMAVQTFMQLKDMGLSKDANKHIIEKMMGLDDDAAELISGAIEKAPKEDPNAMGGGFGGGNEEPPPDFDQPQDGTPQDEEQ